MDYCNFLKLKNTFDRFFHPIFHSGFTISLFYSIAESVMEVRSGCRIEPTPPWSAVNDGHFLVSALDVVLHNVSRIVLNHL